MVDGMLPRPAEGGLRALIVIEERALFRHFLVSWLASMWPELETIALTSLTNNQAKSAFGYAALVVLGVGRELYCQHALEAQILLIRSMGKGVPIALLGDSDVEEAEEVVRKLNLAGYIPMTCTSEVAAAALRLIMAGGRYVPRNDGFNLPDRGAGDFEDLASIADEAEALPTPDKRDDRLGDQMCRMNEPQFSTISFTENLQLKEMRAALCNILVSETHAQALEIARIALETDQERQG